jgi:hypothetical protein
MQAKTVHALDRAATVIGSMLFHSNIKVYEQVCIVTATTSLSNDYFN